MKRRSRRSKNVQQYTREEEASPLSRQTLIKSTVLEMQKKMMWSELIEKIKSLVPLRYNKTMKYKEEWERQSNVQAEDHEQHSFILQYTDKFYMVLVGITLVSYCMLIWLQSVKEIFGIEHIPIGIKIAWVVVVLVDMFTELHTSKIVDDKQIHSLKKIRKIYFKNYAKYDIANLIVVIIMFFFDTGELMSIVSTAVSIYTLYQKITEKYYTFKTYSNDVEMIHQFKILQLFMFLLLMGHIFSLLLYGSALVAYSAGEAENWVSLSKVDTAPWYTRYIYSLYWAITTMTTVGYGDIHGCNQYELVVCIVVEILGSAIFGYMINVIGMTLTDMKKSRQELEDDLIILKKLSRCFSLSHNLTYRIRNYIQNNHLAKSTISMGEENRLFERIDSRLKYEVLHNTNMKIVQKNTFLLTQFTRNFRDQIAVKLIKKIFQPNEFLQSPKSDFSLFVIDKGVVEILYNKQHNNKQKSKPIRTIKQNGQRVSPNTYGLAELLCSRRLNLTAKSKSFTVAYELKKHDFMETIQQNPLDYERFCELRDHIMFLNKPESFQGSLLLSTKQHYCPHRLVTIKKHNYAPKQARSKVQRRSLKVNNDYSMINHTFAEISIQEQIASESLPFIRSRNVFLVSTKRDLINISDNKFSLKPQKQISTSQKDFDMIRAFENYNPKCNFNKVINRYYCWMVQRTAK